MAFRTDSTATYTYVANSTGGTVDLGARNNYRYVNATNVYNKGKADGDIKHTIAIRVNVLNKWANIIMSENGVDFYNRVATGDGWINLPSITI